MHEDLTRILLSKSKLANSCMIFDTFRVCSNAVMLGELEPVGIFVMFGSWNLYVC